MIKLKRAYYGSSPGDGERILVERLWPRGLTRERAKIDLWLKDVAPTPELRKWFGHDPAKWEEFRKRYETELKRKGHLLELLKEKARKGTITFIYAAKDETHNGALALKQFLEGREEPRRSLHFVEVPTPATACPEGGLPAAPPRHSQPLFPKRAVQKGADLPILLA
jgi:uncharacterized protein YeaO (DUF488 family)